MPLLCPRRMTLSILGKMLLGVNTLHDFLASGQAQNSYLWLSLANYLFVLVLSAHTRQGSVPESTETVQGRQYLFSKHFNLWISLSFLEIIVFMIQLCHCGCLQVVMEVFKNILILVLLLLYQSHKSIKSQHRYETILDEYEMIQSFRLSDLMRRINFSLNFSLIDLFSL